MQCILAVCADSVAVDARTNSVSLFHITDTISAMQFPALHLRLASLFILTKDEGDPDRPEARFEIILNGNNYLLRDSLSIDFAGRHRTRSFTLIEGLVIPAPGVLRVVARTNDRELGHWDITVNAIGPALVEKTSEPEAKKEPVAG
jgi:hypothetical protein